MPITKRTILIVFWFSISVIFVQSEQILLLGIFFAFYKLLSKMNAKLIIIEEQNMDIKTTQEHITATIKEFFSDRDTYQLVDVDTVIEITLSIVLKNWKEHENDRYEAFYNALGKATAICQGWKQNEALDLKSASETSVSLTNYIEKTYGTSIK